MSTLTLEQSQVESLNISVRALSEQIELLRTEVAELKQHTHATQERLEVWDDFAGALQPIVKEGYALAIEELRSLEGELSEEDIIRLARRLLRNIRTFETLLAELENGRDFLQDALPLTQEMMASITEILAQMEAKGYPDFGRELLAIVDRVVTTYRVEDVQQLGSNIVLILNTVKAMTQPEIMRMMSNLTGTLRALEREPQLPPPSLFALLRQLNDPDVRRGLSLTLNMVKAVNPPFVEELFN